jgi:hypothetical protein
MPKEIEIIPPQRTQIAKPAVIRSDVPTLYSGGRVQAMLDTGRWNAQSRALDSLARVNASEANLRTQQTALVGQDTRFREALLRHQELPEKWGHELALRRAQRANELREAQHGFEMQETRRRKEYTLAEADYTHAKATLTHARTVLKDAEQQYDAQCKYGHTKHHLTHAKDVVELVKTDLEESELRAMIRRYLKGEAIEDFDDAQAEEDVDALYDQVVAPKK